MQKIKFWLKHLYKPVNLKLTFKVVVIGRTVGLISSAGRAPDLQAGGPWSESCIGHTFSSLVYFKVND